MAMGCYALGGVYHLCLTLSNSKTIEGFTPMFLGHIGFFLFIITASYGQLDRIVDDGSKEMKPARSIALTAPVCAALLYIPNVIMDDMSLATKITYALVWIPAMISVYFNLKHAIIPDLDFSFIKVIKPYNVFVLCLSFTELMYLSAWNYLHGVLGAVVSVILSGFCVCTMVAARRGVEKWII